MKEGKIYWTSDRTGSCSTYTTISDERLSSVVREVWEILPDAAETYIIVACHQINIQSTVKVHLYNASSVQCSSAKLVMVREVLQCLTVLPKKKLYFSFFISTRLRLFFYFFNFIFKNLVLRYQFFHKTLRLW